MKNKESQREICFHCGDRCGRDQVQFDSHVFCCEGCKTVYGLLKETNLCQYYTVDSQAGNKVERPVAPTRFAYLDEPEIEKDFLNYKSGELARTVLFIPSMHCASCIWLLEKLYKFLPGILSARVNFDRKELEMSYDPREVSLRSIVEKLTALGYEPSLQQRKKEDRKRHRYLLYRLGVAGFAMGNIMLFSFPEYLGMEAQSRQMFAPLFQWLNLLLALPVVFFSAQPFFVSAWKGIRAHTLNIDFPLALGISTLFIRSAYEVLSHTGPGFFDSLSALVFFLLIGRWMQDKAYEAMSFERDYTSYFPVAVQKKNGEYAALNALKVGDRILVRSNEIVPADSRLVSGEGRLDYSFVSGETRPVKQNPGEMIYAGGRQMGGLLELEIIKPVSQSYLTSLWNQQGQSEGGRIRRFSDTVGRYFTWALLLIAVATLFYWIPKDTGVAINAFTAVLIVACPCVLVIAAPFALGNAMRWLGRKGIYLKNPDIVEKVAAIDTVAFDKTGTLTESSAQVYCQDFDLNRQIAAELNTILSQSAHPLARMVADTLEEKSKESVSGYEEVKGKGILARINGHRFRIGSAEFTGQVSAAEQGKSEVWVLVDDTLVARFMVELAFRQDLDQLFAHPDLPDQRYLFSGDRDYQRKKLEAWFDADKLHFQCSPEEKQRAIRQIRESGHQVMMLGDGLNDAGALSLANVGVAITENVNTFTPASDVIMMGQSIRVVPSFIAFCRHTMRVVKGSFIFSLIYNSIWMVMAVQGQLDPMIAALLMPVSSVTVFAINTIGISYFARKGAIK